MSNDTKVCAGDRVRVATSYVSHDFGWVLSVFRDMRGKRMASIETNDGVIVSDVESLLVIKDMEDEAVAAMYSAVVTLVKPDYLHCIYRAIANGDIPGLAISEEK